MALSRCLGSLFPARFSPPALEQEYAVHKTEDVRTRCLLQALSCTAVMIMVSLSFMDNADDESLFTVTGRVQVGAVGIAALLYAVMLAAHYKDGAASRMLRKYNDAAQTIPAVYICMVAPVVEPYRLIKLFGSTYAKELEKQGAEEIGKQGAEEIGQQGAVCMFTSYEAQIMVIIINVVASAAIFGRTPPPVLTRSHREPQPAAVRTSLRCCAVYCTCLRRRAACH